MQAQLAVAFLKEYIHCAKNPPAAAIGRNSDGGVVVHFKPHTPHSTMWNAQHSFVVFAQRTASA